jgi:hypothetical protein
MFELSKLAQSTYAADEFGQKTSNRIELIASFTELISIRIEDAKKHGQFVTHRFKPDRDSFDWCEPNPLPAINFDSASLRTALSTIRTALGLDTIKCTADSKKVVISVPSSDILRANELFGLVKTFGIIDWDLEDKEVILKAR